MSEQIRLTHVACTLAVCSWVAMVVPGNAQETCGFQQAKFGTDVFEDRFEAFGPELEAVEPGENRGGGLGPPIGTVSPPSLGVTPSIAITDPAPGATLGGGRVQVSGIVTGPVGTGVTVNGVIAYVNDGSFAIPEISVEPSQMTLEAVATTIDELSASASRNVTVTDTSSPVSIGFSQPIGFAPLPVAYLLQVSPAIDIDSFVVDFGDGGSYVGENPNVIPRHAYETPGIYTVEFLVEDTEKIQYSDTRRIIVLDIVEQRETVCAIYAHMRSRLAADDAAGAGQAFHIRHRQRYLDLFDALGSNRPIAATRFGEIANGTFSLSDAELILVNLDGGTIQGYPIRLVLDGGGVWRIEAL